MQTVISRRRALVLGAAGAMLATARPVLAGAGALSPALLGEARAALARHAGRMVHTDRIGIADFSRASRDPRLFVVDMTSGQVTPYLVAHGRGSDPAHTGWVERLSNAPGSYASSAGAYLTGATYAGAHGRSMRLAGLEPTNDNAEARAIVVHAAWYVSPEMARTTGKLGRSEGCFAVSTDSLAAVLDQLGPGRLLYAAKV
jgi:hypothetical protein